MNRSESIKELAAALAIAQGDFGIAEFDKVNPHFKSKYASLTSVMNAVRGPLQKNGLSVVQTLSEGEKGMTLETTLLHSSGEWISGTTPVLLSKDDMQGLGSAITYAKRYAVSAMLGVVSDEDDDGNATSGKTSSLPHVQDSKVNNVNNRFGANSGTNGGHF